MLLTLPSVEVMHITPQALKLIERAGRVCYKSEDKITPGSAKKFMAMLLKNKHEAVIEHAHVTFRAITSRGVTHGMVRHRLASYCQESTRYCDYKGKGVEFIIPTWLIGTIPPGAGSELDFQVTPPSLGARVWLRAMANAEQDYLTLRRTGWKPEQARGVLPNDAKTEIIVTMNFRELRHFFKLRCAAAAHPDMRFIANSLWLLVAKAAPEVFALS